MVHKLLLTVVHTPEIIIQLDKYKITLSIKNIGEKVFPGGKFTLYQINYSTAGATQTKINDTLPSIPKINIGQTITIEDQTFNPIYHGLSWVYIDLIANDEEVVELYQNEKGDNIKPWQTPFSIHNFETNEIIKLLIEINNKLDKIGGI